MSENGPYNQPPHNPYGGGDHSGGQPPYGPPQGMPPYGDQNTGGQPGYGGPGGFPNAPEQQMYAGGQPPYGGGPGYPPPPPQQPQGGGKAGLWVVIGGGAVIIILVIAVVIMLVTNGNSGQQTIASEPQPSPSSEETTGGGGGGEGGDEETAPETDATPAGEPPYAVPAEPCNAFTDQVISDFLLEDEGDKFVQEESSYCESLNGASPEGNAEGTWGDLEINYGVPYSASDSIEGAKSEFQTAVQEVLGEGEYNSFYEADNVEADEELDLGDESRYVLTKYDFLGEDIPQATVLIRTANVNIRVQYQLHPPFGEEQNSEDLVMPENIQEIMASAGADALAVVGS